MFLEGESLLNDGTAEVVFRIVAGMVAARTSLSVADTLTTFATVVSGGVFICAATGFLIS
jgi:NhaP-type Na+/H+ or K+/H+ antiporter